MTLVGGEPTLRPDVIQVFCEEMPKRVCVVTNGTYPLKRFENLYFYWISMDGTEGDTIVLEEKVPIEN